MKPVLTVLGREYCHLCEDMVAGLRTLQVRHGFEIRVVDVDADPVLEARWGELVPVLLLGDEELCHYHLDTAAVDARLARMQ